MKSLIYLVRTFRSSISGVDFEKSLRLGEVEPFYQGYGRILRVNGAIQPESIYHPGTDARFGNKEYLAALIFPLDNPLLGQIRVQEGLTGMPELDKKAEVKTLAEYTGGQCLIESVPHQESLPHMVVWEWRGTDQEPEMAYCGSEAEKFI